MVGARASGGDKKRRLKRGLTEAYAESEFGVAPRVGTSGDDDDALPGGAGGLSVSTLMAAAMGGDGGDALGGARRRLDRLANKKARPDAAPLPKIVSERVDRKAAYEATGEAVTKWQPIVKQNREKPTLTFVDQERAKMPRKKSIAALNADFVPENDFEREIMAKLRETNATTGRDVERAEDLALNELTAEEVKERRARLAKMRNLLFRHELKAKRVKAIKSKTFHRHNRKTGALKILDGDGNEVDAGGDDDALAGLDGADGAEARREYLRAQERMLLKHKNTSRWAKRAIRKGLAHLPGTKEAIAEQLRIGQELRRKIGIGGERRGDGGNDDDDEGYSTEASSDDDDGGNGEGDDRRRLAKAKAATLRAIQDGEKGAEEEGGLFALPFMARALKKKREEAEAEAKALLEEIERADRRAGEAADDGDDAGEGRWGAGRNRSSPPPRTPTRSRNARPATRRTFGGKPTAATRASNRRRRTPRRRRTRRRSDEGAEDGGTGKLRLDDDVEAGDDVRTSKRRRVETTVKAGRTVPPGAAAVGRRAPPSLAPRRPTPRPPSREFPAAPAPPKAAGATGGGRRRHRGRRCARTTNATRMPPPPTSARCWRAPPAPTSRRRSTRRRARWRLSFQRRRFPNRCPVGAGGRRTRRGARRPNGNRRRAKGEEAQRRRRPSRRRQFTRSSPRSSISRGVQRRTPAARFDSSVEGSMRAVGFGRQHGSRDQGFDEAEGAQKRGRGDSTDGVSKGEEGRREEVEQVLRVQTRRPRVTHPTRHRRRARQPSTVLCSPTERETLVVGLERHPVSTTQHLRFGLSSARATSHGRSNDPIR